MALGSKRYTGIEKERSCDKVNDNRIKSVAFADESIHKAFLDLKHGKFEEKELASFIDRAINDLKENPLVGIKIPKKL